MSIWQLKTRNIALSVTKWGMATVLFLSSNADGAPVINASASSYDFGCHGSTETISFPFNIKNLGDEKLVVTGIRCPTGMVATLSSTNIEPNAAAILQISVQLSGRSGPQRQSLTLYCNDPKTPSLKLDVYGMVFLVGRMPDDKILATESAVTMNATNAPVLFCENPLYNFGVVDGRGTNVCHVYVVANKGHSTLEILETRSCCGSEVSIDKKVLLFGESANLKVIIDVRGRKGRIDKAIYIRTSDPQNRYYRFVIQGAIN